MTQSPIRLACQAFSLLALALGALIGLYAAVFASRTPCVGHCQVFSRTELLSWWCVGSAILVLVLSAIRKPTPARWAAALAGLGLLIATIRGHQFADMFTALTQIAVPSLQPPLTATAIVLTLVGFVIVVFVSPHQVRLRSWVMAVGAVTALVVGAAGVGLSVRHVDSLRRAIDATTAAPVSVPAPPSGLGKAVFRIRSGPQIGTQSSSQVMVVAGAGFVMLDYDTRTITAFDSAGQARWHYRRSGELRVGRVTPYGNGTTLLAGLYDQWDKGTAVLGLDALTGAVLWVSDRPELRSAYFDGERDSPFLVQRRRDQWTAFDPRTGREMWSVPKPLPCPESYPLYADTTERIVLFGGCDGSGNDRRLITLDPATGAVSGNIAVPNPPAVPDLDTVRMQTAGSTGVAIYFGGKDTAVNRYINATTLVQTEFPRFEFRAGFADSTVPVGDPLLTSNSRGTTVLNADGTRRCTFAPGIGPMDPKGVFSDQPSLVAWAPETITYLTFGNNHSTLRSARRSDCVETTAMLFDPFQAWQVSSLPGATAVFSSGRTSNYVVGFGS